MKYFAIDFNDEMHDLGDCGDIDDAEQCSKSFGIDAWAIFPEATVKKWQGLLNRSLDNVERLRDTENLDNLF
jgi:hypothetical protein